MTSTREKPVPIQDCVGRKALCPTIVGIPDGRCAAHATVAHARRRIQETVRVPDPTRPGMMIERPAQQSEPIRSAHMWFLVDCPKCGKKLYKHGTMVEPAGPAEVTT